MSYQAALPNTGVLLPVPGSGQAWEVTVYNANLTDVDTAIGLDRGRLTTIESKIGSNALVPAGTTAARDGLFGVPASAAARVALANAAPRFFNLDKGYTQQYFAQDGDAGAGVFTRTTAGWYPALDSGRVPLTGFTVGNTGGVITRDGGNILIAGACTALTVNNIFSTDFADYEFEMDLVAAAALDLRWRQRNAGADVTTGYNRNGLTSAAGGTTAVSVATATSEGAVGRVDVTDGNSILLRVRQPGVAAARTATRGQGYDTGNNFQLTGSLQTAPAAHDGITFFPSTSTFSGRIRVFGINPF